MTDLQGQRLGHYQIIQKLGEGGMGSVYRAHQESMGRDVAIKVILSHPAKMDDFSVRFEREVRICASLSHAHIIKVFDYGKHDALPISYLVMELLTGGSLSDLISKQGLSLQAIEQLISQLASALDYAHQKDLIHRDLKPSNVLLDEGGNAYLSDFGLARLRSDTAAITQSGMVMGTWPYMAPEQWKGKELDRRADVYSLGVMLFEMLTGRLPFMGDTAETMLYQHLFEAPPALRTLRPDAPAALENMVNIALAKDPSLRYATAGEMAAAFEAAIIGAQSMIVPLLQPAEAYDLTMLSTARITPITPLNADQVAQLDVLNGHTKPVSSVTFSPDGQTLASAGHDGVVRIWDVATRREIRQLTSSASAVINSLVFSADGLYLAAGGQALVIKDDRNWNRFGVAILWEVENGSEMWRMPQSRYVQDVTAVGFDVNNHLTISGDGLMVWIWELDDDQQLVQRLELEHKHSISCATFNRNAGLLASSDSNTIWVWNVTTERKPRQITGQTERVQKIVFSIDGSLIASIGRNLATRKQSVRLWQVAGGLEAGQLIGEVDLIRGIAFSPDNSLLASGSEDGTVRLWDVATGRELRALTGHSGPVHSVAFSPDGSLLASGSYNNSVRLWGLA